MTMPVHLTVSYDDDLWQFHRALAKLVGTELEDLQDDRLVPVSRATDQGSANHQLLYEAWRMGGLDQTWQWFVRRVVCPMFGGPVAYQAQPTLRIQYPRSKAVGSWHSDEEFGHVGQVTNLWVPLTRVGKTNGVRFLAGNSPRPLRVGDMLIFDGGRPHGNVDSEERWTRVSFDAHIQPLHHYKDWGTVTVNTGQPIRLGDYYASSEDIQL